MKQKIFKVSVLFIMISILTACSLQNIVSDTQGTKDVIDKRSSQNLYARVNTNAVRLACYDIFELTIQHNGIYKNNFIDVKIQATFTSPDGKEEKTSGFYYAEDLWKIRFLPDTPGNWSYRYKFSSTNGYNEQNEGGFECFNENAQGRVTQNPDQPYRWVFDNGEPFFPVGLQDCVGVIGPLVNDMFVDGEDRFTSRSKTVTSEEYFSIYGQSGFNLFRFSPNNCSYSLFDAPDQFRINESLATDRLLSIARKYDFRIMFGFFGSYNPTYNPVSDKIVNDQRFVEYCVARWGVYVDFWELLNESSASIVWDLRMVNFVNQVDPTNKPVSTSWESRNPMIDIFSPHWYESENELESDLRIVQQAQSWKQYKKPVIVGEQGNTGMNWDPQSGLRMRIRTWTALFKEISLIYWNTSYAKNGMFQGTYTPGGIANIYLGPEERGYIHALQEFTNKLDSLVQITPVDLSSSKAVRAYSLASDRVIAAYLHHFTDHSSDVIDLQVILDMSSVSSSSTNWEGEWLDPATGIVIQRVSLNAGQNIVNAPPFKIDLALVLTVN